MDKIFYNGKLYTQDQSYKQCTALAVKDGVILRMGDDKELLALAEKNTQLIDLKGKMLLPGFVDTHLHLLFYSQLSESVDLTATTSFEDVKGLCAQRIEEAKKNGKWITGLGFNQDYWKEKKLPTIKDLDQISTEVPIAIRRACYHVSVCNTKAMEALGLAGAKPGETELNIGFFEDGTVDGRIREDSQNIISEATSAYTKDEVKTMIIRACNEAAAKGITEIHSDDFMFVPGDRGKMVFDAYRELSSQGKLPIRVYQQCSLWDMESLKSFLDEGNRTGDDYGFYRVGPLKIVLDGSLGAHTALMRKPYANDPEALGMANHSQEELYSLLKTAHDQGMQIATHCIGDGSLEMTLDAYEKIQRENPRANARHGVVHCQIMDQRQQDRFRENNLLAYIQPIFLKSDMNIVDDCVGKELASQSYNWRRYKDLGVHQSGGSDCPVEPFDILPNLEYAVTRTNPDTGQSWYPQNGLTVEEAIEAFTLEGAYASFAEDLRGSLTVGKYADLVVVDQDLTAIDPGQIHNAKVVLTMVGGEIKYQSM